MDIVFNCPKCSQELEVDASGVGEEITCPSCSQKIKIPENGKPVASAPAAEGEPAQPRWGTPTQGAISTSAAAKVEKHLKVPVRTAPSEVLIAKPAVPLEVAANQTDKTLKVKSIRHIDCVEVGHDKFDEIVTKFLAKVGEQNLVSVTPLAYTHIDIATQKVLTDYGIFIVYRG
jgi:DNA-directed RNA polymerase subunit RPC12/RpoP